MKKITQKLTLTLILFIVMAFNASLVNAQVLITNGQTVTENFDAIGTEAIATLPASWKVDKLTDVRIVGTYSAALSATQLRAGNNMSSTATNGIYNYGAGDAATASDRAIGFISSSTATKSGNLYLALQNNGAANINSFTIGFDVEKYRNGTRAEGFSIQMYYSLDGTVWTDAGTDFNVSFAGADTANNGFPVAPDITMSVTSKTLNVLLAPAATLYLAWNYSVTTGTYTSNAKALGIDNVSIQAAAASTANDATLAALTTSVGVLSPAFSPATLAYTVALPFGTTATPTVLATSSNPLATVTIVPATDVTSATQANRTTTVTVVSQDLSETKIYTVVFNVATTVSNDATLSALTSSVGTLSPTFSAATYYYTVQLPYGTTTTPTVTATTTFPYAVATVTPATDVNSTDSLLRTTLVTVVAEDGITTLIYKVQFNPTILTVVDVANIAALRLGATDGTLYRLTGEAVMTFKQTYRNQKFIQDATGAIMIDDFANVLNTPYAVGDGITNIIGELQVYNSMLQFIPEVNPGAPTSIGNVIVAQTKTVSQITTADQAKLLKVVNAHFPSAIDTFKVNLSYNLTDATGTIVFRTAFHEANYIGTIVPTAPVHVTGILHQYINTLNFSARNLLDIELVSAINAELNNFTFEAYPNPSTEAITFSFDIASMQNVILNIYDLTGKMIFNYSDNLNAGTHNIVWDNAQNMPAGVYMYSFSVDGSLKQGKLIITK
ncbi:MAG: T9SS type A sorting domain-containing protein [Bacteroidales bacterium]|nr:T9SS type A sorting domain-containing protein [Bacteroidales bacterium]